MRLVIDILLAFTIFLAVTAHAGMPELLDAEQRGDWSTVAHETEALARQGNPRAMYNLSVMYAKGIGVQRDDRTSFYWSSEAAKRGYAPAAYSLGVFFDEGRGGVQKNPAEAFRWFLAAANAGYPDAMFNVGQMYGTGEGTAINYVEAYAWTKLALVTPKGPGSGFASNDAIKPIQQNLEIFRQRMSPAELARAEKLFAQRRATLSK